MLKKTLSLVITFHETTQALAAESHCGAAGLPGRLIPVPREITAGCGLAWKAEPNAKDRLCAALDEAQIIWAEAHILEI